MSIDEIITNLCKLEEKIETIFLRLALLEQYGEIESSEYYELLKESQSLVDKETKLLSLLKHENGLLELRKRINKFYPYKKPRRISLGHLNDAYYLRLMNKINTILGEDSLYYEQVLRHDLNSIIMEFINLMLNNPYYEDIKEDLTRWKYDLIFLNDFSEDDMFENSSTPRLDARSYHTEDFFSYIYVDKCVLGMECIDDLAFITNANGDFRSDDGSYTTLIIAIVNALARLTLCDNDLLEDLNADFDNILESDTTPIEVKELIIEMLKILENIKGRISGSRN